MAVIDKDRYQCYILTNDNSHLKVTVHSVQKNHKNRSYPQVMIHSPQTLWLRYRWRITRESGTPMLREGTVFCGRPPEVIPFALNSMQSLGFINPNEQFRVIVWDSSNTKLIDMTKTFSAFASPTEATKFRRDSQSVNNRENKKLWDWQIEAIETWLKNDCRGVVEAATGTGKTRLALECARHFQKKFKNGIICVVVPTVAIFDHWEKEVRVLKFTEEEITRMGASHHDRLKPQTKIFLAVQQTAIIKDPHYSCRLFKELSVIKRPVLLVFDEVHHIAADQTFERLVKHIPDSFKTLGLSATPDRRDGLMDRVYKYFDGPRATQPVYTYSLMDAVGDGVLSRVKQYNYFVGLDHMEWMKWKKFEDTINELKISIINNNVINMDEERVKKGDIAYLQDKLDNDIKKLENWSFEQTGFHQYELKRLREAIEGLLQAYRYRRRVLNKAECKWDAISYLFSESSIKKVFQSGKWVFFHQEVEECQKTARHLIEIVGKNQVAEHHTQIPPQQRNASLEALNRGEVRYLCAVQTLDEGVNIPTLDGAVIVSGKVSKLQQVQRCGRALRKADGKNVAYLVFLLIKGDDDKLGEKPTFDDEKKPGNWEKCVIELPFPRFGEYEIRRN